MGIRLTGRLRWLLFLALPFAMFAWMVPFVSGTTLGNDYPRYGPTQQIELMWCVWKGTFPLYMPGFADGHSTAAMTLGQLYHPISWLSSLMPGYRTGHALAWNTCFRLLSLGLAHALLFGLCRRLSIAALPAFVITFPVVYNLRMLDSFRYGPAIEAYVAMLLAVAAIGYLYLQDGTRRPVALLGLCVYLLAVSGHPQWACYGFLAVGLFALLFPWLATALDPTRPAPGKAALAGYAKRLAIGFGTGGLLASPYLLTFSVEYLATNGSRIGRGYVWTLWNGDSPLGELCNFLLPFHADVHGAFAGSALFLLAALFPIAALAQRPPKVLWLSYGICVLAFLFAVGPATGLHPFVVQHIPLFDAFRVPGRSVLLIPLFALPLWAWLFRAGNGKALLATSALAVMVCASCGLVTDAWLPAEEHYTPHRISAGGLPGASDDIVLWLSAATLALVAGAALRERFARSFVAVALLAMLATTWLCLRFGTWYGPSHPTTTFAQISAARASSVMARMDPGTGMELASVTAYIRRNLGTYTALGGIRHRVEQVDSDAEVLRRLAERSPARPLFVDRPVAPMAQAPSAGQDQVVLVDNTSNRFGFEVSAAADGYFVLRLPWLPGFTSTVDGAQATVVRADALLPAVFVPAGRHRIEFRFISWAFLLGVALAFSTTSAWALWLLPRRRLPVAAGTVLSGVVLAWLVHRAILGGPSYGTNYRWQASPEGLAFHHEAVPSPLAPAAAHLSPSFAPIAQAPRFR
jgi:hypothetical protein